MKRFAKLAIGLVLATVLLFGGLSLVGYPKDGKDGVGPNQASNSADAGAEAFAGANIVAGLGIVEPESGIIELSTLMPGVVAVVHKAEGDPVKRGEIVAELVNDDLKAIIEQAQSTVKLEAARLALLENGPRKGDITRAAAVVKEEQSNVKLLEIQLQRREKLASLGAISREVLDQARRDLVASQQRKAAASEQLEILKQGSRQEEVDAARASHNIALQKLEEAKATLNKSYIRATVDGIVLRVYSQAGEALAVQPATSIMQIADISRLVVRTQIDESDIVGLKVGQKAKITAPALQGKPLLGTVKRISPRLGAKTVTAEAAAEKRDTRVLEVIVALEPGVQLPVNLRVDVVIDLDTGQQSFDLRGTVEDSKVVASSQ